MAGKKAPQSDQTGASSGFEPFVPAATTLREFTLLPLVTGTLLGLVFGASSLYLVLKVGLTVSASIPVAVISITLFRLLARGGMRPATILENNIVQTAGSAGESIAFGLGVTMPAILILGFELEIVRLALVGVLGGLLGILMMIPLRRALIVKQHGVLKYPEGTACAEVLKAGALAEQPAGPAGAPNLQNARTIFAGFGIGLFYKFCMVAVKGWKDIPEKVFGPPLKAGSISAEISPELLGVGYIIGPRYSAIMCGGGVLASLVLIPAIKFFGEGLAEPLAPGSIPIREMGPAEIRGAYILYIGAGAVAAGGIISLFRSLPIVWHGIREGLVMVRAARKGTGPVLRTDHDLSFKAVLIGILVLLAGITAAPPLHMNLLGAGLIVVFGFLFATVSSRLTGEIGSSSNPISGMTVATLLLTCLIFLVLGWTAPPYYVTALSVGAIVCIAASNAGTTSQDLKTGYLIGATPRLQQWAILIGTLSSALLLGPILLRLNDAATVYVPPVSREALKGQPVKVEPAVVALAPQADATLMGLAAGPAVPGRPAASPLTSADGTPLRLLRIDGGSSPAGRSRLDPGDYLAEASGLVVWRMRHNFSPALQAPRAELQLRERLSGPQAAGDTNRYWVWQKTDPTNGPPGKYLVNDQAQAVYLVDPGINGVHKLRPDGTAVTKYDAPKATLMSYIIKGILGRKLPWSLVLIGVMIAIVLEMAGIASLAFAVGVYLRLSSSTPIFLGAMVRWLVDRHLHNRHSQAGLTPEEIAAESDKSPGVLLASGYIAGGAITGIAIAFVEGVMGTMSSRLTTWAEVHNPCFSGPWSDLLSLVPFAFLTLGLYLTGRERLFRASAGPRGSPQ
jgi:putative OPT family oligopeptide transporter